MAKMVREAGDAHPLAVIPPNALFTAHRITGYKYSQVRRNAFNPIAFASEGYTTRNSRRCGFAHGTEESHGRFGHAPILRRRREPVYSGRQKHSWNVRCSGSSIMHPLDRSRFSREHKFVPSNDRVVDERCFKIGLQSTAIQGRAIKLDRNGCLVF
jgi:hypothetical protein